MTQMYFKQSQVKFWKESTGTTSVSLASKLADTLVKSFCSLAALKYYDDLKKQPFLSSWWPKKIRGDENQIISFEATRARRSTHRKIFKGFKTHLYFGKRSMCKKLNTKQTVWGSKPKNLQRNYRIKSNMCKNYSVIKFSIMLIIMTTIKFE